MARPSTAQTVRLKPKEEWRDFIPCLSMTEEEVMQLEDALPYLRGIHPPDAPGKHTVIGAVVHSRRRSTTPEQGLVTFDEAIRGGYVLMREVLRQSNWPVFVANHVALSDRYTLSNCRVKVRQRRTVGYLVSTTFLHPNHRDRKESGSIFSTYGDTFLAWWGIDLIKHCINTHGIYGMTPGDATKQEKAFFLEECMNVVLNHERAHWTSASHSGIWEDTYAQVMFENKSVPATACSGAYGKWAFVMDFVLSEIRCTQLLKERTHHCSPAMKHAWAKQSFREPQWWKIKARPRICIINNFPVSESCHVSATQTPQGPSHDVFLLEEKKGLPLLSSVKDNSSLEAGEGKSRTRSSSLRHLPASPSKKWRKSSTTEATDLAATSNIS